jgi:hypothetical protein
MPIKQLANGTWEITLEASSFWAGETYWITPDGVSHHSIESANKRQKELENKV